MSTDRLLGRTTGGTGVYEELSVGTGLTLASGSIKATDIATNTLVGRTTGGTGATEAITVGTGLTFASGIIKATDIATNTLVGRTTGGTGATEAIAVGTGLTLSAGGLKATDIATSTLVGRTTAGTGATEAITVGTGLSLSAGTLTATGGSGSSPQGLKRNLLYNCGFLLRQRSTGPGNPTTSHSQTNYYGLDRWGAYRTGNGSGLSTRGDAIDATTRGLFSESLPPNELFIQRTFTDSVTTQCFVQQAAQAIDVTHVRGRSVVFSFIARKLADWTGGVVSYRIVQSTNATNQRLYNFTGATNVATGTFTPSLTATRYEITGSVATSTTQLGVEFSWTPTSTGGANDVLYITAPQLELGTTRTLYENITYQDELIRCQWFYEKSYDMTIAPGTNSVYGLCMGGMAGNGTSANGVYLKFKIQKRDGGYTFKVWDRQGNANRYSTRVATVWSDNLGVLAPILASVDGLVCDSGATALNSAYVHYEIDNDFGP
jgi:hypothetical protein